MFKSYRESGKLERFINVRAGPLDQAATASGPGGSVDEGRIAEELAHSL
jgi:hypothetical protein